MEWAERSALVALNATLGMGPGNIQALVQAAGSAVGAVTSPGAWHKLTGQKCPRVSEAQLADAWSREQAGLATCGADFLTWNDDAYPASLHHLEHPPPVLAYRGNADAMADQHLKLAVVGARACTPYGRSQAERFGAGLAAGGAVVVSGGARGIDRAAMEGAVEQGRPVVAVLGSGVDRPYPPESARFFQSMVDGKGLLLSEFPCGMTPARGNFPRRNRILAALCRGVLVVQATVKSGSMITVGWALNLGRDVFAVPGNVDSTVSQGPHRLLKDGAMLVDSPMEILAQYQTESTCADTGQEPPLLARLNAGDRSLDSLSLELQRPAELLLLELVELELRGLVTRVPGGLYHRCGPRAGS